MPVSSPPPLRDATIPPPPLLAFGSPLALARPPLCPELELWLLGGELDLEARCHALRECEPPPYWAFCWGSGQALARFILDRPERVAGCSVVDFGAGGGVAGIAAARAGAARVVAVDRDPDARSAALHNARRNGVHIECAEHMPGGVDVVLASDILYEAENLAWVRARLCAGQRVLLSDPERAASPRFTRPPDARYAVTTLPDVDSPSRSAVVFDLAPGGAPLVA